MKRSDLNALEQTLARLTVDIKKNLSNQLLGKINAQADTLIATVRSYPHVPTAAMSILSNGGMPVAGLSQLAGGCSNLLFRLLPST